MRVTATVTFSRRRERAVQSPDVLGEHRLDELVAPAPDAQDEPARAHRIERAEHLDAREVRRGLEEDLAARDALRHLLLVLLLAEVRPYERECALELAQSLLV